MEKQPTEHDVMFQLHYSYYLEVMTEILNRRVDTAINAVILTLGAAVFANSSYGRLFGGIVAVLTGFRIACKFSQKAANAKAQTLRYSRLIDDAHGLTPSDISHRLSTLEEFDSDTLSSLLNPARQRAIIKMGLPNSESLSLFEKLMAFLAGGIPK
ncbi:hypothetical protein [Pectobacterium cacticida]|uniref:hypothetical protein n=1 Tax=Pectobacterium cacticida TaxID=69221 RepID=UPI0039871AD7